VDQARSAHTGGFGVGLAIAERAVKLHRGQLRVLARDGGGTTIQMILPCHLSAGASAPVTHSAR
jgi:two-component system sensor histidine kinase CpxA